MRIHFVLLATLLILIPLTTAALVPEAAQQGYHDTLYVNELRQANSSVSGVIAESPVSFRDTARIQGGVSMTGGTFSTYQDLQILRFFNPPAFHVDSGYGNVGIGAYSTTTDRLYVDGNTLINGNINSTGTICDTNGCIGSGGSSPWISSGSGIHYTGGDVGIGHSTTSSPLDIRRSSGDSGPVIQVRGASNSVAANLGLINQIDPQAAATFTLNKDLDQGTPNTYVQLQPGTSFIDSNRVGLGINIPSNTLDVNGKIRMRTVTEESDPNDIVVTKGYLHDLIPQGVTFGEGEPNQVAYWNGSKVLTGDGGFTWANNQQRLTVSGDAQVEGDVDLLLGSKITAQASGSDTMSMYGSCQPYSISPFTHGRAQDAPSCSTSSTHTRQQSFTTDTCATCNKFRCIGGDWDGETVDYYTCEAGEGSYVCSDNDYVEYVDERVCEQPQERQSIEFSNFEQDLVTVESTQKMGGRIEPQVTRVCAVHIRQGTEDSISHIHAPAGFNYIDCQRLTDTQYLTPSSADYLGVRYALMCITASGVISSPWTPASDFVSYSDRPDCGW